MATLNNHPVWENVSEVVNAIDANSLLGEHLALWDYQISGGETHPLWENCDRLKRKMEKMERSDDRS